jgi:MYXO-CTERM domain-containing protein
VKQSMYGMCFATACYVVSGSASAQSADPNPIAPAEEGAAGAGPGETYLPGPGGGTIDSNGALILESTGLEDGGGGCKCSSALGAATGSGSPVLALMASLALLRRRRRETSVR